MFLSRMLSLTATASAIIVRRPQGPHPVSHSVHALTDDARWDPFASDFDKDPHKRRIVVSVFSPLAPGDCPEDDVEVVPYMPPVMEDTYRVLMETLGLPQRLLDGIELEFCKTPGLENKEGGMRKEEYPVVIFSPGFTVSRLLYGAQAQSLASHGYTVITVDHPYDATAVEFPNGDVIYGYNITDESMELGEASVGVRTDDILFLLNQLPELLGSSPCKGHQVFLYGHSLGGATALQLTSLDDPRILGGLNLDGMPFLPINTTVDKPFFLVGSGLATTPGHPFGDRVLYEMMRAEKMLVSVGGSQHLSFRDVPLVVAIRGDVEVVEEVLGTIQGARLAEVVNELLVSVARFVFEDEAERLCGVDGIEEVTVMEKELPCSD